MKYLLHGGSPCALDKYSDWQFFRKMADAVKKDIRFLYIPWAGMSGVTEKYASIANDNARRSAKYMKQLIEVVNPHKKVVAIAAPYPTDEDDQKKELARLLGLVDVVYVEGGDGDLLQERLTGMDLPAAMKYVKVCAGNSAGANMWSRCYYSNDNQAVCDGLDIIPVKTFCHYNSYKWPKLNELVDAIPTTLPVITISDHEFVELEF